MTLILFLLASMNGCTTFAQTPNPTSDRPNESDLFGSGPTNTDAETATKPNLPVVSPTPGNGALPEGLVVSATPHNVFDTGEVTDNPLQMGGIYYQRMIASAAQGVAAGNTPISAPLQVDGFLDGRPNDRIRAFVDARLMFDPTRDQYSNTTAGPGSGSFQSASTSSAPTSVPGLGVNTSVPNNPQVGLDQAWLKFDIDRTVFVTAGKQHVKWGVSRFWNPTDLLNTQKRDPLLPYDLRLGNTMAKFEVPVEAAKSNFYAIALFDNPQPASTLAQIGGAFRAETTAIGNAELGIDAVFRGGTFPVYGLDFSTPVGPLDFYLEAAYKMGTTFPIYQVPANIVAGSNFASLISIEPISGPVLQTSGGISYDFAWRDNRQATIGAEYFYNQIGYTDPHAYPALIFLDQFQPFYTGRHYAAIYLTAEGPDAEKHTSYTLSTLGNLSDMSFITRLDFSWRFLTYLTFEAYVDGHYGTKGGEFNFALNTPYLTYAGSPIPPIDVPRTLFDVGVGLRVSF